MARLANGVTNIFYLEDIVEKIFSYLDYDTLCLVQQVCRYWQRIAHEKILKNYPPYSTNLPIFNCEYRADVLHSCFRHGDTKNDCLEDSPSIKNLLTKKPDKVAIILTDGNYPGVKYDFHLCMFENIEYIMQDYLNFLPSESFVLNEHIYVDDIEISGKKNVMAAVFFPKIPSIEIRSYVVTESKMANMNFEYSNVLTELFDLDNPEEKRNCVIILGINENSSCKNLECIRTILDHLKNMNDSHKLTVWGGAHVQVAHRDIEFGSETYQWHVLHIIGINSYSIALNLDMSEESFKKKLIDFKNTITFKKESFALAITHTKDALPHERDQIIKKVLWFKDIFNIRLNTILTYLSSYSCNPIIFCNPSDNANLRIEKDNTVGYLIITN